MGHSVIEYQGRAILMLDAEAILLPHAMLDRVKTISVPLTINVKNMLKDWQQILNPYAPGCIDLQFDKFLINDQDREGVIALFDVTAAHLQAMGKQLPASYLNHIVNAPAILQFEKRDSDSLLKAIDILISLIKGNTA